MKSASKKRAPTIVNLTLKRRYLTQREIERLMDCTRQYGRYGHRDATMILVAYRHGLRASEVCDLQWQQITLWGPPIHHPADAHADVLPAHHIVATMQRAAPFP
jgi:integrase